MKPIDMRNDAISEEEIMKKTGYSRKSLYRLRTEGTLMYATVRGSKKLYSLKQLRGI
jgi:hypothetical protein